MHDSPTQRRGCASGRSKDARTAETKKAKTNSVMMYMHVPTAAWLLTPQNKLRTFYQGQVRLSMRIAEQSEGFVSCCDPMLMTKTSERSSMFGRNTAVVFTSSLGMGFPRTRRHCKTLIVCTCQGESSWAPVEGDHTSAPQSPFIYAKFGLTMTMP